MFRHEIVNLSPLERTDINGRRHYITPDGVFPSVTTVLGEKLDKTGIENWKKRVGKETVERVSRQATVRGSAVHKLCEDYLMNQTFDTRRVMPFNLMTFKTIKPILDSNIDVVYGIEAPLYSKCLNTAGTTDLLARFNSINSVIDFKTSKREKKEEWIESYFIQATCYSLMAEELIGLKFPQIVIIITNDNYEVQTFVKSRDNYIDKVFEIFK